MTMNVSCVCLQNVSDHACDICTTESSERCSGAQGDVPLWLTAVILPLITSSVIVGMFVVISRLRRRSETSECLSLPQKSEQGADNAAFCCDDGRPLTDAASVGKERCREPVCPYLQKSSVHLYCEASASGAQPELRSELEYYEVGSICSELHSDSASLKHPHRNKQMKGDVRQWRDLMTLLAEPSIETSATCQKIRLIRAAANQQPSKTFPQPEFSKPVPCLTLEEITKLNAPLSSSASPRSGPDRSNTVTKVSPDCESDSTLTCSESEFGRGSAVRSRVLRYNQHPEDSSDLFEQWGHVLNTALPFCSYVPVFEDVARLPVQPDDCHDLQSDIEEMI